MAYEAFTITSAATGERVGSIEAQSPEEAVFRLAGGEWGRTDFKAWSGSDRPMAAEGLTSFRYNGPYGWIMIGAKDGAGALREAARSLSQGDPEPARLQVWSPNGYI